MEHFNKSLNKQRKIQKNESNNERNSFKRLNGFQNKPRIVL